MDVRKATSVVYFIRNAKAHHEVLMTPNYNRDAIEKLLQRTEYESWFLEEVYRISEKHLNPEWPDALVYPPNGSDGVYTTYGAVNIILGDWRPGFLDAGAPLIFVSTFKLLDMILEWILKENGLASTFRFAEKIKALRGTVIFPAMIDSNPWLRDRLVALYEQLAPLRGTIIHDKHFQATPDALHISSSKNGNVGPEIIFAASDLRNLSLTLVSIIRFLQGAWALAEYQFKRIRRSLDELAQFHGLPSLGQLPPSQLTARIYAFESDRLVIDVDKIRRDVARFMPGQDVMFDVRAVLVSAESSKARAVRIPWSQLENAASTLDIPTQGQQLRVDEVPLDIAIPEVAAALSAS